MYQRLTIAAVALIVGYSDAKGEWLPFVIGLVLAAWLVADERAIERLDVDRPID